MSYVWISHAAMVRTHLCVYIYTYTYMCAYMYIYRYLRCCFLSPPFCVTDRSSSTSRTKMGSVHERKLQTHSAHRRDLIFSWFFFSLPGSRGHYGPRQQRTVHTTGVCTCHSHGFRRFSRNFTTWIWASRLSTREILKSQLYSHFVYSIWSRADFWEILLHGPAEQVVRLRVKILKSHL